VTSALTSVVVPDLDSPWIGETLGALAEQGAPGPGVEVLVVGRDGPGLVPRQGPVRLLATEERLAPAAARNRGVAAAGGRRLAFVDADCRPLPGWLATLTAALDAAPVAGGAVTFPRRGNRWALAETSPPSTSSCRTGPPPRRPAVRSGASTSPAPARRGKWWGPSTRG
jgi:glycosyltransferase involved in cell wall biosynthesis